MITIGTKYELFLIDLALKVGVDNHDNTSMIFHMHKYVKMYRIPQVCDRVYNFYTYKYTNNVFQILA